MSLGSRISIRAFGRDTGASDRRPDRQARRARPAWQRPGLVAVVSLGGAIGACARYELSLALPAQGGSFPVATFLINVSGSFALGGLLSVLLGRGRPNEYVRPFLATGVIGAYTTWSTFMTDADKLIRDGDVVLAAVYIVASLAAGFGAVYAGAALGRGRLPRRLVRGGGH